MNVVDCGEGTPLVLLPGVQGRWEYMRPTVDALARHFRVLTFSLGGERSSGWSYDRSKGLDSLVEQAEAALDDRGISAAIICGVSFGGLIALRFAAHHRARTLALVLASTPGPGWHLKRRHDVYARWPWVFGPAFFLETPWRLRRELRAALPDAAARRQFRLAQLGTLLAAPVSPARIAERARLIGGIDAATDCRHVAVPTLVLTGERDLDHVVNADEAAAYGRLIGGARTEVLPHTGHLGCVTQPLVFASRVRAFWTSEVEHPEGDGTRLGLRERHDAA